MIHASALLVLVTLTCDPPRASNVQPASRVAADLEATLLDCLGSLEVLTATESPRLAYQTTLAATSVGDLQHFLERLEKRHPAIAVTTLQLAKKDTEPPWRVQLTLVAPASRKPAPRLSALLGFLLDKDDARFEIQSLVLRSGVESRNTSHVQFTVPTFRESVELMSRLRSAPWLRDVKSQYKKRDTAQDLLNLSFRVTPTGSPRSTRRL